MFISKVSLPRRTFLRGVGATLALPLLDAMVPAATALAQTAATRPSRFGFIYVDADERNIRIIRAIREPYLIERIP